MVFDTIKMAHFLKKKLCKAITFSKKKKKKKILR